MFGREHGPGGNQTREEFVDARRDQTIADLNVGAGKDEEQVHEFLAGAGKDKALAGAFVHDGNALTVVGDERDFRLMSNQTADLAENTECADHGHPDFETVFFTEVDLDAAGELIGDAAENFGGHDFVGRAGNRADETAQMFVFLLQFAQAGHFKRETAVFFGELVVGVFEAHFADEVAFRLREELHRHGGKFN